MRGTDTVAEADSTPQCIPPTLRHTDHSQLLVPIGRSNSETGQRAWHIPIELTDGSESANVPTTTRQNREVVSVQGEKETFRREFWLRKWRLIAI